MSDCVASGRAVAAYGVFTFRAGVKRVKCFHCGRMVSVFRSGNIYKYTPHGKVYPPGCRAKADRLAFDHVMAEFNR